MSRKTKQQKIIADLRRQLAAGQPMKWEVRSEKLDHEVRDEKIKPESHVTLQHPSSHVSASPTTGGSLPTSTLYIKKDLTKTLIMTILAISLELVLHFILG